MTTAPPVARTPLDAWHAARGATFAEREGWRVVARYSTPEREAGAARAGLGLADVSASAKVSLRGRGTAALFGSLAPHGVTAVADGRALACRLADDHVLLLGSGISQRLAEVPQWEGIVQTDVTSAYAGFWVVGPRWEELLARLTHLDVRAVSLPVGSCAETMLAGVEGLLVRTAELPLPSLRVYVAWDLGEYAWDRVLDAGRDLNITPLGVEALGLLATFEASRERQRPEENFGR
jgi:sarcosine oxidase subunit alpha